MIASLALTLMLAVQGVSGPSDATGAWLTESSDGATGAMIVTDDHFSIAWYRDEPAEFVATMGGKWSSDPERAVEWEFHTSEPERIGTVDSQRFVVTGDTLEWGGRSWRRVDSGAPGALEGAWLMTGRKRDGEISTFRPGVRRTMKILSGTRFQWIAFNVETKEFFGTGGGTYSTVDGRYTENIEFFSRDVSRTGVSLPFDYEMVDGAWHHSGKSSTGDPLYELWTPRSELGI